jgi:phenylacetic acid degradation operon negative regulatory protein
MTSAVQTEPAEAHRPELKMSRKLAAGAGSTRSYLFTILGEFVMPDGGAVWTSKLVSALGMLGFEQRATRQALARTAADSWLQSQRVGRRTCWRVTSSGERVLAEGRDRIFHFRGVQENWDGRWLVVLTRLPDAARASGHQLRTRLRWAGFGSPIPGVWVSTHVDRLAEAERAIAEADLGGEAQLFISQHVGRWELADMVRQAWDLSAIQESYQQFLSEFDMDFPGEPLTRLVRMAHSWRRLPMIDPALPLELLPSGWPGVTAADRFRRLHEAWSTGARAQWRSISESDLPPPTVTSSR